MSKIVIVGAGYVGLANALLFAQAGENVTIVECDDMRVQAIQRGESYFREPLMVESLKSHYQTLKVANIDDINWSLIDMVLLCVPTNFDEQLGTFDTSILDSLLEQLVLVVPEVPMVIKSTVPIGYTLQQIERLSAKNIIFSPEFLREGSSLSDSLYPERLVFGGNQEFMEVPANLYQKAILNKNVPVLTMSSTEAEMVKLFSNVYLAMRVAFFNELDSVARDYEVNTQAIIEGMSYDRRIGNYYNNPSFGYGGYCLPKDTKQLIHQTKDLDLAVIPSIYESNERRKQFIVSDILARDAQVIGIYSLQMKKGADNSRESAIIAILKSLKYLGKTIIVYDDYISRETVNVLGVDLCYDLEAFKAKCDLIVTNRWHDNLRDVSEKVYTRDIFGNN
ncbi:TPA: nucleotide sugar dehydrogenase [Streptococcus suis]